MVRASWMKPLIALVLFATGAPNVLSQPDRTPRGPSYSTLVYWPTPGQLIAQDEIARDLKLTADQQESIRKAQADYQQALAANPPGGQNFAEVSQKRQEATRKLDDTVRAALGDKAKRLDQIAAQSAGLAAFVTRVELRQQLGITEEQLAKGRGILDAAYKEMTGAGNDRTRGVNIWGARGAENRAAFADKTTPKLLELLIDEQKKKWQTAIGELVPPATLAKVRTWGTPDFAAGQGGGGFGERGGDIGYRSQIYLPALSQLMSQEDLVKTLNLTADQLGSIRKAQADYQQAIAANPLGGGQNAQEVFQKQQEAARKRDDATRAALGDKLKRLDQIAAQSAGLAAFVTRVELRQQLAITDEQVAKSREILETVYKDIIGPGPDRGDRRGTSAAARGAEIRTAFVDKTNPKLLELLTNEQKKRWQDAVGDPVAAAILVKVRTPASPPFGGGPRSFQTTSARLYQEAQALEKGKDYLAAVKKMNEAINLAPENDLYRAYASNLERLAGNFGNGVELALQAIKINEKKVAWYYASVAFNAHAKGDHDLARTYCKKVIDFGPATVGQGNYDLAKKLLSEMEQKK